MTDIYAERYRGLTQEQQTCCLTGHRKIPPGEERKIMVRARNILLRLIRDHNVRYFGVGGAVGFDMLAAEYLLNLKAHEEQQIKIKTDALTGLLSRHAYSAALDEYKDNMPQDFIAFSIDVNGLKKVNDTWGHEAGDELICAAARLIERVYGKYGECFRTGGDEFIVLAQMNSESAGKSVDLINRYAGEWHNDHGITLSLSIGYA